jgi:outer membrane receptor for ferrienterochelin and colicins
MKLHWRIIIMAFALLFLIGGISQVLICQEQEKKSESAQKLSELSLGDLLNMQVVTASKKAESTTDAPGIISTISSEEIKYLGGNSLLDILERATSIQSLGSSLFPDNISVMRGDLRALYDNHVLILINGRPVREGVLGGINSPVYTSFPIETIDKIEIIRGPGSVLYGSNAFAGVINIITKNEVKEPSLTVKATGGEYGTFLGTAVGTWTKEEFTAKVGIKAEAIDGWNYSAMTVRPGFPNMPINKKYGQSNLGLTADLAYKSLTFFMFYANSTQDILGILPYPTYAGKNKYDRIFLNLGYTYKIKETWDLSLNLSHSGTKFLLDDEAAIPVDKHSSADYLGEITLSGEMAKNLNVIVGGVYDSRNKNVVGATDAIKVPYHQKQLSAYLQADYRPVETLKLIAGAQMNKPDNSSWDFVPRVGVIYNITNEIGVKALYGKAFRSPWPIEQLLVNPAVVGNPNLVPEKIATTDVQLFYTSKNTEASITFYNSMYTNSITRLPIPSSPGVVTYVNQGSLHTNGIELEGKTTVSSDVIVIGSATYQNNVDRQTVVVYVPDVMGKIGAILKLRKGLTIGVFNTVFGKPRSNNGQQLNPEAKAVDLLSINVNYKLPESVPLEFNVYAKNLLGTKYMYTEFNRGWVNTLPVAPGTGIYGSVGVNF